MAKRRYPIFAALETEYADKWPWPATDEFDEPFRRLVLTVLSQNTNDENCMNAYRNLSQNFDITPLALVQADEAALSRAIKTGGLHRVKAERLKLLAATILETFRGELREVLRRPTDEARAALKALPGVGDKTADVLLAFSATRDVIPIDTHITRITRRLGLASQHASYDAMQRALENVIPVKHRARAHVYLIMFGREYCKARSPRCEVCPLRTFCAYHKKL